ncbi:MAG TPA: ribonuclease H-like domain-containing protein [Vicinamibacterales bacterium]|nr:ribonuclease H-like domain-containing protein [Vicinamibacterales bacterium]
MDRATLAARIQGILRSRPKTAGRDGEGCPVAQGERTRLCEADEGAAFAQRCEADAAAGTVLEVLGGEVRQGQAGACLVVERSCEGARAHGREEIAGYAEAVRLATPALSLLTAGGDADGVPDPVTPLFFDLETTGLSGGAGTYAFLVGCGWFENDGFRTTQFFLRGYAEERALLHAVAAFVRDFRRPLTTGHCPPITVVTYNGRSFDLPVMETRYVLHRLVSPFAALQHLDLLFPARRLWQRRLVRAGSDRRAALSGLQPDPGSRASCALTVLEEDILGFTREGDVPGWEIPGRYFAYTRSGDAQALEAVLEHNRLDLISLGALTGVVARMLAGRGEARDRWETLALARLLEFVGRSNEAERHYRCAAEPDGLFEAALDAGARAEALRWLAVHYRRARRFLEAAEAWNRILDLPRLEPAMRREALEALAMHHEHRARDLAAARRFAVRALDLARRGRGQEDLTHRVNRLARKLAAAAGPAPADPAARTQADLLNPPINPAS